MGGRLMMNTLRLVAGVLLILLGVAIGSTLHGSAAVRADAQCSVPKAWGTLRGGDWDTGLIFEDAQGTIRFLTTNTCREFAAITRK